MEMFVLNREIFFLTAGFGECYLGQNYNIRLVGLYKYIMKNLNEDELRMRTIELTLVSCYLFLLGSDLIFYYSLQDEETRARFQTIVDLGAIELLKN